VFGISGTELLLIGVFAFIIFGPDKIPEVIQTVNKAIKMFKSTQEDMERLIKAEVSGLDLDKPLFNLGDDTETKPAPKPEKTTPSTASSLYGLFDDDEEDEE